MNTVPSVSISARMRVRVTMSWRALLAVSECSNEKLDGPD